MLAKEINDTCRKCGIELLQHSPNSPDSVPFDLYLYPKFKSRLPGLQSGNNPCCRGEFGGPGGNLLP